MTAAIDGKDARFEGLSAAALAERLSLPTVSLFETVASTMDVAHTLAVGGARPGTLVVANSQTAGRGRGGREWTSDQGGGIWITLLERPRDREAVAVLSIRIGLAAAAVLDCFTDSAIRLKWPNDLYTAAGKVGGVLIEARWRDLTPEWVAIGIGINVRVPGVPTAAALRAGTSRLDVLDGLVPALRGAAALEGHLASDELACFAARDLAAGRRALEPGTGTVRGLAPTGEIIIAIDGREARFRAGSLVFDGDA